jgi:hypothetical protein
VKIDPKTLKVRDLLTRPDDAAFGGNMTAIEIGTDLARLVSRRPNRDRSGALAATDGTSPSRRRELAERSAYRGTKPLARPLAKYLAMVAFAGNSLLCRAAHRA